jgi:protein TonB
MHTATATYEFSPLRISAGSIALGLHLIVFGLLILPPRAWVPAQAAAPPEIQADFIAEVVAKPPPVPEVPAPPRRPSPQPRRTATPDSVPVTLAESAISVPVTTAEPEVANTASTEIAAPASHSARIAYGQASPPPYPGRAKRLGWEGTVLLRVRVDTDGRPREVVIERSSGHRLLDRSASEHVLGRWRFEPAVVDGEAVAAWARVPITFRLERG